jgi:nitroimidazol reductase NimA-like FMN-containing flavoprotein (pyridoxamine 5'-phosphate oxidase superfamily)
MIAKAPAAELDSRFSSPGAVALPWTAAVPQLQNAGIFWLSTVRPDGRPHVAPLIGVWQDGGFYFCTGAGEQKAKNIAGNARVVITTGANTFAEGLDVVLEGEAIVVSDNGRLQRLAEAFVAKYGEYWRLPGRDGVFTYEVNAARGFGFGRGSAEGPPPRGGFSQTRWRFDGGPAATRGS